MYKRVSAPLETHPSTYKPIILTNRHKRYVHSHNNNQQSSRKLANGFPAVIDTQKRLVHQPKKRTQ